MHKLQTGATIDQRTEEDKDKDYKAEEAVASSSAVNWVEKTSDQWRKFPIFNQDGSGSCVAQSEAKEMGIMRWLEDGTYVHFSATDIYQRRNNRPASGMWATDARDIVRKGGATLEALTPSQSLTDSQMDGTVVEPYKRAVGEVFKVPNYLELPSKDIERVASTIQATGKGVMVWFYFTSNEWTDHPVIHDLELPLTGPNSVRHCVTAVDYCLVDGKKCLIIDDSWGPNFGVGGQRVIDEGFFIARNWHASYLINFRYDTPNEEGVLPSHQFDLDMEYKQTSMEIVVLQDCLKYEGLFPDNIDSSGYYGSITRKAVQKFQLRYGVTTENGPGYGRCGPKTRDMLNNIYA